MRKFYNVAAGAPVRWASLRFDTPCWAHGRFFVIPSERSTEFADRRRQRCGKDVRRDPSSTYNRAPRLWSLRLFPRERSRRVRMALSHAAPNLVWLALPAAERARRRNSGVSHARGIQAGAGTRMGRGGVFVLSRGEQRDSAYGRRGAECGSGAAVGGELWRTDAGDAGELRRSVQRIQRR